MQRALMLATAAMVLLAACSGGDVSEAEYDQTLTELALAQQELVTARNRIAELEEDLLKAAAQPADLTARLEDLLRESGVTPDPGLDPFVQLSDTLLDFRRQITETMVELERLAEAAELDPGAAELHDRLDAYLSIVGLWAGSWDGDAPPPDAAMRDLIATANRTLDMELVTALDELIAADATIADHLVFLQQVVDWAHAVAAGDRPPG